VRVIDTSGPVEKTHTRVKEIVIPFLEHRGFRFTPPNNSELEESLNVKTGHC
jgi:hypothetical protein